MVNATAAVTQEERPAGFLGLMRNRNYALLWWGQLVSEMGNRFHWIAVSLWIYSVTGSASAVSIAISSMFVGNLLVSLWAGVIVDRFNRKIVLVVSDLSRATLVGLIPWLIHVSVWLVYADLVLVSVATAFFRPAIFAVVPAVVQRKDLLPANAFFSAMDTGTEIAGPAAAGVLAFKYGYAPLLYIDALSYLTSALCILAMSLAAPVRRLGQRLSIGVFGEELTEGIKHIRTDPLQWALFVLIFPATLVGSGLNALQTPLAKSALRVTDAEFGIFQAVWGVGFLVSSLMLGWFGRTARKSQMMIGGFFVHFAATGAMGLSASFDHLLLTAFAVGFANTLYFVSTTTVLMEHTPGDFIGRVMSTRQVAIGVVRILSPLTFGAVADVFGIRQAVVAMAALGAVGTGVVLVLNPVLRRFDAVRASVDQRLLSIWRVVSGPVNPEMDNSQQRRLNIFALSSAFVGWLGLFLRAPAFAIRLIIAVAVLAYVGSRIHRRLSGLGS